VRSIAATLLLGLVAGLAGAAAPAARAAGWSASRTLPSSSGAGFPFDVDVVHVLTAHNPGAERPGPAENTARQDRLVADLRRRGLRYWAAVAGAADGAHAEASVVVAGLGDDEACAVGAAWGQDAVFRWSRGAWSVVACDDAASVDLGWEIEVDA